MTKRSLYARCRVTLTVAGLIWAPFVPDHVVALVLGAQGIYMLHLESRALVSLTSEEVCFTCRVEVGPTDAGFAGTELDGPVGFVQMSGGAFRGVVNVLLGSHETADGFADSEVDVAMECDGYGFSGAIDRTFVLRLPPS